MTLSGVPSQVSGHRPRAALRTTPAGTWYLAVDPDERPAGLLLVDPAVDLDTLVAATEGVRALGGGIPVRDLVLQGTRVWLITSAAPGPTLGELIESGERGNAGSAATLMSDLALGLSAPHGGGLAHGRIDPASVVIGPDGHALLADWGSTTGAGVADDAQAWARLTWLLARLWCVEDPAGGAVLARAADAAARGTLADGLDELLRSDRDTPRAQLAESAHRWLGTVDRPEQRRSGEPSQTSRADAGEAPGAGPATTLLGARKAAAERRLAPADTMSKPGPTREVISFGPGIGSTPSGQTWPGTPQHGRPRNRPGSGYRAFLRNLLTLGLTVLVIVAAAAVFLALQRG